MKSKILAVMVFVVLVFSETFNVAYSDSTVTDQLIGTWNGRWYNENNRSGKLTLVVEAGNGEIVGTLAATGVKNTYGDDPQPLVDVAIDDTNRTFDFKAYGEDGSAAISSLTLSKNGKKLKGHTQHKRPYPSVRFSLKKQ